MDHDNSDTYEQIEYRIGAQGDWVTGVDGHPRVDIVNHMGQQKVNLVTTVSYLRGDTVYLLDTASKSVVAKR